MQYPARRLQTFGKPSLRIFKLPFINRRRCYSKYKKKRSSVTSLSFAVQALMLKLLAGYFACGLNVVRDKRTCPMSHFNYNQTYLHKYYTSYKYRSEQECNYHSLNTDPLHTLEVLPWREGPLLDQTQLLVK